MLVAGGTLAAGQAAIARAAFAGSDETVRIGLVGCGGRGTGAAAQAMNTRGPTRLVAVGDAFEDNLLRCVNNLKRQHADKVDVPAERQFVGLDAYKHVLAQEIDLVILATPPGFRPLHFEAAVDSGVHVFFEKPLAVDGAGVRRILHVNSRAKEKGLLVQVGLQRRHERAYMETMKRLHEGIIGDIVLGRSYWNSAGVWVRPRKEGQTEMQYQMRNWYYFNWLCGDHIVEQHIHNIDVINWLKQGYPVKAQGQGGRQVRTGREHGEIYDHHMVEFTYADGSVNLSQCRHIRDCWNSVNEYCHGTKGYCEISKGTIFDAGGRQIYAYGRGGRDGHQQEHHDLFADLRAGKRPNEGDYGAMSTMTAILGRLATYSGKEVTWDDALNSEVIVAPVDRLTSFDDDPPVMPNADMSYPIAIPGSTKVV